MNALVSLEGIVSLGSVAKNKKRGAPLYFSGQILKCQILSGVASVGDDSGLCQVVL